MCSVHLKLYMKGEIMKTTKVFKIMKIFEELEGAWFSGIYVIFLQKYGLTLFQATQVDTVFMRVISFFDPYTGALADKLGQKNVYLAGSLLSGLGLFFYGLSNTFMTFALAEAILAVAYALRSETLESLLSNQIPPNVLSKTLGNSGSSRRLFSIPVTILGGIAANFLGFRFVWYMGGITAIAGFIFGIKYVVDDKRRYVHINGLHGSIKESLALIIYQT